MDYRKHYSVLLCLLCLAWFITVLWWRKLGFHVPVWFTITVTFIRVMTDHESSRIGNKLITPKQMVVLSYILYGNSHLPYIYIYVWVSNGPVYLNTSLKPMIFRSFTENPSQKTAEAETVVIIIGQESTFKRWEIFFSFFNLFYYY